MRTEKISINKVCLAIATLLVLVCITFIIVLYRLAQNTWVIACGLLFAILTLLCVVLFIALVRRKLTLFSDALCRTLDDMLTEEIEPPQITESENLFYKINHRLARLYEVMRENRRSIAKEQASLQELISDISHQVKTPIANLKMVNATLLEQEVSPEKQLEFLKGTGIQLDKLDFLMQTMIKTSRLETGVISLEKKSQLVYDTLAAALGGILLGAEKKDIHVSVSCPEKLKVSHDRKWTSEALFNILDNAVKYTPEHGSIHVAVDNWEMYVKIDIADTGRGIAEQNQGSIFKRFYREDTVHDAPGVGIGLYLARKIITMQGGYIKVVSEIGEGSRFSVFLPHK
ncbi:HAMP domain-containing sensor histidine kinase [Clostridium sp. MB40-C1]|uniref:sensor histidine kinase n=1 Tax=Clostridium sp. MB40-C1 TaxID=3070996 RepID=UPI0027E107D4|nr:HAMP domain-containing sensor histidine kinase [Clostridium sp. MB40-C1]WMJ81424.1 HAMP domain-containing sensor histidine kinase [Clostridium sp. MB40-C1]